MLDTLGLLEDVSYRFSQWDPKDTDKYISREGLSLKDAFNQLKKIDGKEIELEIDVNPGDYINEYEGPYAYGKGWNKIKSICNKASKTVTNTANANRKNSIKPLSSYIENGSEKPKYADDYVDWDSVVKNLFK